ncbi:MAG: hypothetical protein V3S73_09145, partial [Gammaproteobacteria bacterium]
TVVHLVDIVLIGSNDLTKTRVRPCTQAVLIFLVPQDSIHYFRSSVYLIGRFFGQLGVRAVKAPSLGHGQSIHATLQDRQSLANHP